MPESYNQWEVAQTWSEAASEKWGNFKEMIQPLTRTKIKDVLDTMWKTINSVRNLLLP